MLALANYSWEEEQRINQDAVRHARCSDVKSSLTALSAHRGFK